MDRLDNYLVQKGFVQSRNKAAHLIKEGSVVVDGAVCKKPSFKVSDAKIEITTKLYISRAGQKLEGFLNESDIDIKDKTCLDIGASTGGFVEVLLQKGAKEVTAVDVGKDQLHPSLKDDSRVISYEGCDIRDFSSDKRYDILTCDLSFISLGYVLSSILHFAKKDIIILFKPQFEVGKDVKRDKKGVVKDFKAIEKAVLEFENGLQGCKIVEKQKSKIAGKEGNVELFYRLQKN